ncbi:RNA polymerase sigma-70, Bacteroidetes type [gut metagenome]|uniref:RNA polymerase sigma-70, Bacteroidetes type n=1 Tax=gut metagenome TaxID=749906 RepID=J9GXV7_9ZZZZ
MMNEPPRNIQIERYLEHINVDRIKRGDQEEFHKLFLELYPRLMALACRFVTPFVAEDMVQSVFEKYWMQKTLLQIHSLPSYLYKCTQNECLNYLKHQNITQEYAIEVQLAEERIRYQQEQSDWNDSWNDLESKDLEERFRQALNHLPPKCRQAFELSFYEEMTYKEIAQKLSVSPRTIEEHVQKAIGILRKELHHLLWICLILWIHFGR